jgi:hypothetical protein
MAPLVDSPFSARVVQDERMPASEAVAELFDGCSATNSNSTSA